MSSNGKAPFAGQAANALFFFFHSFIHSFFLSFSFFFFFFFFDFLI